MCSSTCYPLKVGLSSLQITFNHNILKMPYKRASAEMGRACKTSFFFTPTAYIIFTRQSLSVEGNGYSPGKETFILLRQHFPKFWSGNIF
jgi:hypothetical protein